MAIFNAPQEHSDHPLRAARSAVQIQREIEATMGTRSDATPRFGIGINTGPALVGNIGSADFRNFTAIGDTTNIAARLQALAEPGRIVLGPVTAEKLGQTGEVASLGAVSVRGKSQPIEAFALTALRMPPFTSPLESRR